MHKGVKPCRGWAGARGGDSTTLCFSRSLSSLSRIAAKRNEASVGA